MKVTMLLIRFWVMHFPQRGFRIIATSDCTNADIKIKIDTKKILIFWRLRLCNPGCMCLQIYRLLLHSLLQVASFPRRQEEPLQMLERLPMWTGPRTRLCSIPFWLVVKCLFIFYSYTIPL